MVAPQIESLFSEIPATSCEKSPQGQAPFLFFRVFSKLRTSEAHRVPPSERRGFSAKSDGTANSFVFRDSGRLSSRICTVPRRSPS